MIHQKFFIGASLVGISWEEAERRTGRIISEMKKAAAEIVFVRDEDHPGRTIL